MLKTSKRVLSIALMAVMITTAFGAMTEVNAASGLPKVTKLKANAQKTSVSLSWKKLTNKQKKKVSGIAIYRDGKQIKLLGKKVKSFKDTKLKSGKKYTYTVKTYKTTSKKEWYNKKTKKWQKKKPAKKYRGKSRKVKKYGKAVKVVVKTKTSSSSSSSEDEDSTSEEKVKEYTITWKNYNGNTLKTDKVKAGDKPKYTGSTPTKPETDKYTYEFDGWNPSIVAASENTSYTAKFKAIEKTSSYTYNIHFLNEPYGNGGDTVIYLETDNPNRFDYSLGVLNSNNQAKKLNIKRGFYGGSSQSTYDDLDLSSMTGYICICSPECTGDCKIVVYEYDYDTYTDVIVKTKSVNIKNYYAEQTNWMQSVINSVTDSSMTNKQKMNAICSYYYNNFTYSLNDGNGQYITLLSDVGKPYWKTKRTNSAESPAELVEFGTLLGYPLQNMYNVYNTGTPEWNRFHMCAYSAEDNEYYEACPSTSTGYMNSNSVVMFNPNTYQFWGE